MSIAFQVLYAAIAITSLVIATRRKNRRAKTLGIVAVAITGLQALMWALYIVSPFESIAAAKAIFSPAPDAVLPEGALNGAYLMLGPLGWVASLVEVFTFLGMWAVAIVGLIVALRTPKMTPPAKDQVPVYAMVGAPSSGALTPAQQPVAATTANGLALAAIIVVWFSSIIGLVLGHVALSQIAKTGQPGRGMALTAVIVGWVVTGITIIAVGVTFAIVATYGGWGS